MSDHYLLALLLAFCAWVIFAHPPRGLSPVEYRTWYRGRYLRSFYWRTFSRVRRFFSFGICWHWYKGRCGGPRHVHHIKWAYRWLYWEWTPHVFWFGMKVICERHHKRLHK